MVASCAKDEACGTGLKLIATIINHFLNESLETQQGKQT
jgi:hypothetical protein